jgi:protein TonB
LAAPVVRSPIGRSALLTGNFTRAQAEAIVSRLPPRTIGMQLRPAPWASAFFGRQSADTGGQDRPFTSKDEGVTLPSVVSETKPVYTQAAKDAKIQGDMEMSVVVKTDGTVGDVTVTKSLDAEYGLDQAAVDAARLWKFTPGTKGGKAVPVEVTLRCGCLSVGWPLLGRPPAGGARLLQRLQHLGVRLARPVDRHMRRDVQLAGRNRLQHGVAPRLLLPAVVEEVGLDERAVARHPGEEGRLHVRGLDVVEDHGVRAVLELQLVVDQLEHRGFGERQGVLFHGMGAAGGLL